MFARAVSHEQYPLWKKDFSKERRRDLNRQKFCILLNYNERRISRCAYKFPLLGIGTTLLSLIPIPRNLLNSMLSNVTKN